MILPANSHRFSKNRIIKKLFLKIGTISLSPLKQTVFIEDFFTVVQQSLSAPELEIRVSAAESFANFYVQFHQNSQPKF